MTDIVWPPSLRISRIEPRLIGNAGVYASPLTGATRTVDRSGTRWGFRVYVDGASDQATVAERAIAEAFLARVRDRNNRVWIPDPSRPMRGTFPDDELISGAGNLTPTGWTVTEGTVTGADGTLRLTMSSGSLYPQLYHPVTTTINTPYVLRCFLVDGPGTAGLLIGPALTDSVAQSADYTTARNMRTVTYVTRGGGSGQAFTPVVGSTGFKAGDFLEVPFVSASQCALVDNGLNDATYSDQLDNAIWPTSHLSVTPNAAVAPDGTSTADSLVEDSATSSHLIDRTLPRSSGAEDLCVYGFFKRGSGTRDLQFFIGSDASNYGYCNFDLGAGTASAAGVTGTATNARAFIRDAGNGWYFCAVIARFPATTEIKIEIDLLNAGSPAYAGNGTSSIYAWRVGAARTSVPTRGAQTTSAASTGTSQTGSGLYLKGLPASTSDLVLPGSWAQIGDQLVKVTAPLASDAAGLGYLSFSPNLRVSPADNDPVIFCKPMAKCVLVNEQMEYSVEPGNGTYSFDFVEAL